MGDRVESATPDELLGRLSEVERRAFPRTLYLRGDRALLQSGLRVAVVGSRRASPRGLELAEKIAAELVAHGVTVVSGLALGIDTVVHRTAIREKGRTVAILGTALEQCAVSRNRRLQEYIGERHLLVSQFPPGATPQRSHFPQRNKTMALLSHATAIVEASEDGGTRHQGWEAIKLGRPVLFPRSFLDSAQASWPKTMCDYGAVGLDRETLSRVLHELPHRSDEPVPF